MIEGPDEPGIPEPEGEPEHEYSVGDEAEEWAPDYDELNRQIRSADAELSLVDAELDAADAKLDLAESRLSDMETALDAAQAALSNAEAELEMYKDDL